MTIPDPLMVDDLVRDGQAFVMDKRTLVTTEGHNRLVENQRIRAEMMKEMER